ncbi:helix-turn-helix domain-containing protein [Ottowia thiooxydans]|uniref:helix-turn-helix domain-containing protein n=1 Tax=Ottowia thiooxydans TaxID=219182 RepID=UPI000427679B|nr:transcriptional regulator [Ottowia thiooxydans]
MKPKRSLAAELMEGLEALEADRVGKVTLRKHVAEIRPAPEVSAAELLALRERLHLSRPVFAGYLRINPRTLENWEQGRAKPNAQAAVLIRLVEKFPDTMQRLATV